MLTARQEQYTLNLFNGMSQRDAYLDAGYSKKNSLTTVDRNACLLAKNTKIITRLAELREAAKNASIATHDECCQVATEIIRGRFSDFVTCGADGSYVDVGPEKLHSAALKKVKSKTEYDDDGSHPTLFTDVELESKLDAINVLAKLKGWLKPDIAIQNNNITIIKEVEVRLSEPNQIIQGNNT